MAVPETTSTNTPGGRCGESCFHNHPTLSVDIQRDVYARMAEILAKEKAYCDEGNWDHIAQIATSIALYETLQSHGTSEEAAHRAVSEEMWAFLDPSGMQKLARLPFFMPLMKKVVPAGFKKGSGAGWRYTWHDDDPPIGSALSATNASMRRFWGSAVL